MTRGSRLRSFLHPTRMIGRPAQKCMTSAIHCNKEPCLVGSTTVGGTITTNLFLDVVERIGGVNGETDQNNMGVRVGKRSETIVVFLACGIPQGQLNMSAVDLDICDVVLEHSGYIDL
jgi:hypothetical protein